MRSVGKILLTAQWWWVVINDWSGMEGMKVLNSLEAGMLGHLASEWSFQVMRREIASALSWSHSGMGTAQGPPLGRRAGLGDGPRAGWSAHADALRVGAEGAKVQRESAHDASLQTSCRTRTIPNALFILFFFFYLAQKCFLIHLERYHKNSPIGVTVFLS